MKMNSSLVDKLNKLSARSSTSAPQVLISGNWYSWEEGDAVTKTAWVADKTGKDKQVSFDAIEQISEVKAIREAKIDEPKAERMIQQTLSSYPKGDKRTFMLKQILMSMMRGMNKKQGIMRANALVLKYDLDRNDKIPLYRHETK